MVSNKNVISEWWIKNELEESGLGLILRYYPSIYLEGEENHYNPQSR
jgi:hypothetical protein